MTVNKVLVVDDSVADLKNIEAIITDAGYQVISATSGEQAVTIAKTQHPDIIFMDVIMPDMDGFAACREITNDAATKDIPVVFVTSKNQKADRMWAQLQGGKAFITKPYQADDIIDQLKGLR